MGLNQSLGILNRTWIVILFATVSVACVDVRLSKKDPFRTLFDEPTTSPTGEDPGGGDSGNDDPPIEPPMIDPPVNADFVFPCFSSPTGEIQNVLHYEVFLDPDNPDTNSNLVFRNNVPPSEVLANPHGLYRVSHTTAIPCTDGQSNSHAFNALDPVHGYFAYNSGWPDTLPRIFTDQYSTLGDGSGNSVTNAYQENSAIIQNPLDTTGEFTIALGINESRDEGTRTYVGIQGPDPISNQISDELVICIDQANGSVRLSLTQQSCSFPFDAPQVAPPGTVPPGKQILYIFRRSDQRIVFASVSDSGTTEFVGPVISGRVLIGHIGADTNQNSNGYFDDDMQFITLMKGDHYSSNPEFRSFVRQRAIAHQLLSPP